MKTLIKKNWVWNDENGNDNIITSNKNNLLTLEMQKKQQINLQKIQLMRVK